MWNFEDRADAGRELARELTHRAHEDCVVLGLPRSSTTRIEQILAAHPAV